MSILLEGLGPAIVTEGLGPSELVGSSKLVMGNFYYHIGQVAPVYDDRVPARFRPWDPAFGEMGDTTGSLRMFHAEWIDSTGDVGATHRDDREAWHRFRVYVYYPFVLPMRVMHRLVLSDRHDLIHRLRDPQNRIGYEDNSETYAAGEVGLMKRHRIGDVLDTDASQRYNTWRLTTEWACFVRESEI